MAVTTINKFGSFYPFPARFYPPTKSLESLFLCTTDSYEVQNGAKRKPERMRSSDKKNGERPSIMLGSRGLAIWHSLVRGVGATDKIANRAELHLYHRLVRFLDMR